LEGVIGKCRVWDFIITLEDESETGHGGGADDRDGGGHGKAVGLGGRGSARGGGGGSGGGSGRDGLGDGLSAGLVGVGAGVGRNALAGRVCSVRIPALQADVGGGSELNDGVGRRGADVSRAADGVQLGVDGHVGRRLHDGGVDGDKRCQKTSIGGGLDVGDHDASGIGRFGGDCAGCACAAAAVGLVLAAVRVAVCEDGGGKAEDQAVLDLHLEGWRLLWGGGWRVECSRASVCGVD
jgi:hypothetical protein